MKTQLATPLLETPAGREADAILRSCVHCGFCLATCPTYQLLGDELDSPRGRIYLIKQALEGAPIGRPTQLHLDRCLTCRACETTCPSGVRYGELVEIGRAFVDERTARPVQERLLRRALRLVLPEPRRFAAAYRIGRSLRRWLPARLRSQFAHETHTPPPVDSSPARRTMIVLEGCVQPTLAPEINAAARNVFARLGIRLEAAPNAGCCGALDHHLNAERAALDRMRRNIDAWLPMLERGAEAIVVTASGCGVEVKDYGRLLSHDPAYAEAAQQISAATLDLSEALTREAPALLELLGQHPRPAQKIAFQAPCTLQHGQRIVGTVEALLAKAGYTPTFVPDAHLCCGSAGTYSLLHPEIAARLREQKLVALQSDRPALIATANIGCLTHLRGAADIPVVHWISLIEARLAAVQAFQSGVRALQ